MKKFILGLFLVSFSVFAAPAVDNVPFSPFRKDVKAALTSNSSRLTTLEASAGATAFASDGILNARVARVTYDVAVSGGTIGAKPLGVSLPAKALITRSYFYINTQFVDAGSGTVALSCEDANNLKTATDITGSAAGAFVEGASTGAASAFVASIAASCVITATVAGADQSAGSLTLYVEYVVTP